MIKLILVGMWVCAVTLGSSYAAVTWLGSSPASGVSHDGHNASKGHGGHKSESDADLVRPRMISVPVVADGAVQGYVVAQFIFKVDVSQMNRLSVSPEPLLLDESFKTIYAGETVDFRRFRKQDLPGLGKRIQAGVNKRLGLPLVQDVLIHDFSYVAKDEARGRIAP